MNNYWFNGRQIVPTKCGWCGDRLTVAEMQVTEPQPGPDFGLVCDACAGPYTKEKDD